MSDCPAQDEGRVLGLARPMQRCQHLLAKPDCNPDVRASRYFANQQFGLIKGQPALAIGPHEDTQRASQPQLQPTSFRSCDFVIQQHQGICQRLR